MSDEGVTQFTLPGTLSSGTYYLRVRQNDLFNLETTWTSTVTFEIGCATLEDMNCDGAITPADVVYVINRLGSGDLSADVDNDGDVDNADVNAVLNQLGN